MLSRHAENLFWAGRYVERAEDTTRMLDVTYHGLLGSPAADAERSWYSLLSVLGLDAAFANRRCGLSPTSVGDFLVLDGDNPGSIVSAVGRARENFRSVRELVTTEVWEAVNAFHLELSRRDLRADLDRQPASLFDMVKRRCQTIAGVAAETMPRDDGWRFLQLGWMLERAEMTCRLIDVRYSQTDGDPDGPSTFHRWLHTLKSASALEAYRKIARSSMAPADVVDFLLLSPDFPRSVLFSLRRAETDLRQLAGEPRLTRPERLLGRIRADLEFLDVHEVMNDGMHPFLDRLQRGVHQAAEAVAIHYFRSSQEVALRHLEFHPAGGMAGT